MCSSFMSCYFRSSRGCKVWAASATLEEAVLEAERGFPWQPLCLKTAVMLFLSSLQPLTKQWWCCKVLKLCLCLGDGV